MTSGCASQASNQDVMMPKSAIPAQDNASSGTLTSRRMRFFRLRIRISGTATSSFKLLPLWPGSTHGRCFAAVRLVVGMRILATPFHRLPFRVLARPLRDVGRRSHGALFQRTAPVEDQMG